MSKALTSIKLQSNNIASVYIIGNCHHSQSNPSLSHVWFMVLKFKFNPTEKYC